MLNNRIVLKGNLTKDPEYKSISNKDLVTFRLAVNENIGNGKEETLYLDVDGWDSHARYSKNVSLSKGDRVIVDGRLRQRSWTDKQGNNRTSYTVMPCTFSKVVKPTRDSSQVTSGQSRDSAQGSSVPEEGFAVVDT